MKKIFIYYSLTNNGDIVAAYLKEKHITIRKIHIKDELPKSMIGRILTGGFLASINHKSKLLDFDSNIDSYDEIIIGSPIWNSRLSCPINTILSELDLKDKSLTFILYSGSEKENKATKKLTKLYPNAKIINLKEPKKNIKDTKTKLKNI